MTEHEKHEEIAQRAAEYAVKKTFGMLGVNVDNPSEVEDFREDLRFGKRMRRAADRGFVVAVTIITGGVIAALWVGVASNVGKVLNP